MTSFLVFVCVFVCLYQLSSGSNSSTRGRPALSLLAETSSDSVKENLKRGVKVILLTSTSGIIIISNTESILRAWPPVPENCEQDSVLWGSSRLWCAGWLWTRRQSNTPGCSRFLHTNFWELHRCGVATYSLLTLNWWLFRFDSIRTRVWDWRAGQGLVLQGSERPEELDQTGLRKLQYVLKSNISPLQAHSEGEQSRQIDKSWRNFGDNWIGEHVLTRKCGRSGKIICL